MSSEDTLTRIRRLDMTALAQIHDRYYPDVYKFVRFRLNDEHISEDLTSEVFMRLLDALHRQAGPTKDLRNWLLGTASHLVNDHLRSRYSRPVEAVEDHEDRLHSPDSPESTFDQAWQSQQLQRAMQQLTHEQQEVLALRFMQDYSLEQTAAQMRKSVNAVKALQFRAIESLKRFMDFTQ